MQTCTVISCGQRLRLFVEKNYSTQKEFSDLIGINESSLYRYFTGSNQPTIETLSKFKKAGLSIEWLVDGSGTMYARNSKGMELLEKIGYKDKTEKTHPYERIHSWIDENYGSIRNFSIILDLDFEDLCRTFFDKVIPDTNFADTLENAGCNIDWVLTGEGSMYAANPLGEILQSKKFSSILKNEQTSQKEDQVTNDMKLFNFNDLINIFRLAVRAEMKSVKP